MNTEGKEGSFMPIFIAMIVSLAIAFFWDNYTFIKNTAHKILDPTAGLLLNWNITFGMILIIFVISVFMTIIQKYATDQKTLKEMKEEQKKLNEEMKKVKDNPEKMMQLQKEIMKITMPMMKLSMRPVVYTAIPIILFFRWFMDFFAANEGFRFFGFFSWFWFYLIFSIIFSSILRKVLKVA